MQQDEGGLQKHQVQQVEEFRRDCLDPVGGRPGGGPLVGRGQA